MANAIAIDAPVEGYRKGLILVLAAGVCWSTMGMGIRLMQEAQVWQILFYRSCALAPFLLIVIAIRSKGQPFKVIHAAGLSGVIGALGLVLAFSGGIYAIQETSVANASFLFATAPFFAAALGKIILGEPVRRATWIAMGIATLGLGIMVADGISAGAAAGNAAAIASALGFAVFTVALRWGKINDMTPAVFLSGLFAAAFSAMMVQTTGLSLAIPTHDIGIAVAMGVFQLGTGLIIYTVGSKVVPAAELALLSMTEVVLGPFWVWLFLGETASTLVLAGGFILLLAITGNAISGVRRRPFPVAMR